MASGPFKAYRTASGSSVQAMLRRVGDKAAKALGKQLYNEGQGIIEASSGLVPVDTGTLKSSRYTAEPVREGDRITVEIGYGGPAAKINPKSGESSDGYAIIVHENLEAFHKTGVAKFLELPFNQAKHGMGARIAAGMRTDLNGATSSASDIGITELGDPEI